MENVTQLILDLMDKSVITPRQASVLMRYVGQGGHAEAKLSILERLASRTVTYEQATELLSGLIGAEDLAEKEVEELAFWRRRHGLGMVFRLSMILVLIVVFWTLPWTMQPLSEHLATTEGMSYLARRLITFAQAVLIVVVAPELALFWLETLFVLIVVPYVLLRNVFGSRKAHDKLIWLCAHVLGAAGAAGALSMMFATEKLLLQITWLFLGLISLGVPPIAFHWVGHPKRSITEDAGPTPS